MNTLHARQILIDACSRDYANSLAEIASMREDCAKNGFRGFTRMTNAELLQCTYDAGLQERDDRVNEAAEHLDTKRRFQP